MDYLEFPTFAGRGNNTSRFHLEGSTRCNAHAAPHTQRTHLGKFNYHNLNDISEGRLWCEHMQIECTQEMLNVRSREI